MGSQLLPTREVQVMNALNCLEVSLLTSSGGSSALTLKKNLLPLDGMLHLLPTVMVMKLPTFGVS